ncbi:MAG: cyclic nucleotide-binding domain-containing protein [Magnetococcales bacterium]|nr:cyclic nucleotide-binding domain-containing protein [Magnetococcales bacterium]
MFFHRERSDLGKKFQAGEVVFRQGDPADCLFVILEGKLEVFVEHEDGTISLLTIMEKHDVFGLISLFRGTPRMATARALTEVRLLSIDQRGFLKWLGEDPSLNLRIFQKMAERVENSLKEVVRLRRMLDEDRQTIADMLS